MEKFDEKMERHGGEVAKLVQDSVQFASVSQIQGKGLGVCRRRKV